MQAEHRQPDSSQTHRRTPYVITTKHIENNALDDEIRERGWRSLYNASFCNCSASLLKFRVLEHTWDYHRLQHLSRPVANVQAHPLYSNPYYTDDDIQPLIFTSLVLEAPHAIRLLIPIGPSCTMQASPPDMRLAIGTCSFRLHIARGRCFTCFCGSACIWSRCSRFVERRGGNEVLNDGAVHCEFVTRLSSIWCRFRY